MASTLRLTASARHPELPGFIPGTCAWGPWVERRPCNPARHVKTIRRRSFASVFTMADPLTPTTAHGGSPSLDAPEYWWYRVRGSLLRTVLGPFAEGAEDVLDVGSADGPSVAWLRGRRHHVT